MVWKSVKTLQFECLKRRHSNFENKSDILKISYFHYFYHISCQVFSPYNAPVTKLLHIIKLLYNKTIQLRIKRSVQYICTFIKHTKEYGCGRSLFLNPIRVFFFFT